MAQVIRKKAKAKKQRERKLMKNKPNFKPRRKMLRAPADLPNREQFEASVHQGSEFLNKVLKPMQQNLRDTKPTFKEQISQIREELRRKHHERVEKAKESYKIIDEIIPEADLILEILDARDPNSSRYNALESKCQQERKPFGFILNKIDLVPREIVLDWVSNLRQTAPTLAISALSETAPEALFEFIGANYRNTNKVALVGLPKVGKTTIAMFDGRLREIEAISFQEITHYTALLGFNAWNKGTLELAVDIASRSIDSSIPDYYNIEMQDSPYELIVAIGKKLKKDEKAAAAQFVEDLQTGKIRFYTECPKTESQVNVLPAQAAALESSIPKDLQLNEYIHFAIGEAIIPDQKLLNYDFNAVEEEEEEEEGEEEEEEEDEN